jgi:phospholipid/cholesterol/gamma-HCH transport system substrate-binding protein/paraquat-inducible protein B
MSTKPHYFAIGIFVLIATVLGLVGIVAVSTDAMRSPKYFIETYVDESVQGIDIGTPFKFRGVKVGNVSEISMVSEEYDTAKMYVMIRVALEDKKLLADPATLPARIREQVREGLRLKLVPQGITGLSFLEADFQPDAAESQLEIEWEPKYNYIPSSPAMMTLLTRSLERVASQINKIDLATIGENIESITSNLNLSVQHIEEITRNAAASSDTVVENVRVAAEDLPVLTSNLNASVLLAQELVNESDRNIGQILTNLRYITEDTRELIRMIKRHPGMLLTEPPERNLGIGGE